MQHPWIMAIVAGRDGKSSGHHYHHVTNFVSEIDLRANFCVQDWTRFVSDGAVTHLAMGSDGPTFVSETIWWGHKGCYGSRAQTCTRSLSLSTAELQSRV